MNVIYCGRVSMTLQKRIGLRNPLALSGFPRLDEGELVDVISLDHIKGF